MSEERKVVRKPGFVEKQVIKKVVSFIPTEYVKAIREAAESAVRKREEEAR